MNWIGADRLFRLIAASAFLLCATPLGAEEISSAFLAESDGSFSRPHDLTLSPDRRLLFVADMGNDEVKVLDPETLAVVGVIGRGELDAPHDVAFDARGRLLVADSGNDRIAIYTVEGARATLVGELRGDLASPEGVAPAAEGRVYVSNARRHDVVMFSAGDVTLRAGRRGDGNNEYVRPHDIRIGGDGEVYVADPGNDRIQILTPELEYTGTLGGPPYDFDEPKYLTTDARGWLYVADEHNNQIKILDTARQLVAAIGTGESGDGPDHLNQPEGVEVWDDLIWISDTYNDRIVLYRLISFEPSCGACTRRHKIFQEQRAD